MTPYRTPGERSTVPPPARVRLVTWPEVLAAALVPAAVAGAVYGAAEHVLLGRTPAIVRPSPALDLARARLDAHRTETGR